jgi:hypothetical protein
MKRLLFLFTLFLFGFSSESFCQTSQPHIVGYVGIIHPIVSYSGNDFITNFDTYYIVGLATGINLWKTNKIGFSIETVPFIRTENGTSRVYNVLFHPGVLVNAGKGFTMAFRAAFETSGRFGITPILSKTIYKAKNVKYYVSMPLPVRFGMNKPSSIGMAVQVGIAF